jgi:hypothetical protein
LLDRLVASRGLGGPELTFLQAKLAERRGDRAQAAVLAALCLEKLPGHAGFLDLASEVGADLPPRARVAAANRALAAKYLGQP